MTTQIATKVFKKELLDLFEETFEQVQGIFLDRGTSFFETLETISFEEASRPVSANCASISAQVYHVNFYLQVLLESCFHKKNIKKVNWEDSWQLEAVTQKEWKNLKLDLKRTHQNVLIAIKDLDIWEGENDIGASLAILAHTAYHLGEIRQALCTIK